MKIFAEWKELMLQKSFQENESAVGEILISKKFNKKSFNVLYSVYLKSLVAFVNLKKFRWKSVKTKRRIFKVSQKMLRNFINNMQYSWIFEFKNGPNLKSVIENSKIHQSSSSTLIFPMKHLQITNISFFHQNHFITRKFYRENDRKIV